MREETGTLGPVSVGRRLIPYREPWGQTALNSLLNFLFGFLTQQVHLRHDVNLWDF